MSTEWDVKLKAGSKMIKVKITKEGNRLEFQFGFNKPLMAEIKEMEGAKFHGYEEVNPRKVWSVLDNERNRFQIAYLAHPAANDPENPYHWYDLPLTERMPRRSLYKHQVELFKHGFTRRYCIIASEMGTGKTLSVFEIIEASGATDILYVAPKPALVSVKLEYRKWNCNFPVSYATYDGLKKMIAEWPAGKKPPQIVIFDESSRLKTHTAQRTQAARHLAKAVRDEWGREGFVILMSGSPAPKSPVDWWSQCEIAQPGFLREGSVDKFKKRLAVIETREGFVGGGAYPHLVTWRDDEKKCQICGLFEEAETHHSGGVDVFAVTQTGSYHKFEKSRNEIDFLFQRMRGLVEVKFKKDCLDLPDKIYREIELKPTRSILNAASAIQAKATNGMTAMTLLRELSDGFQYSDIIIGRETCECCDGKKVKSQPIIPDDVSPFYDDQAIMRGYIERPDGSTETVDIKWEDAACPLCDGTGEQDRVQRSVIPLPTPKEGALKELMEECEDTGRIVIYGGFTGSIDRICEIVQKEQWNFIRVDGRGWYTNLPMTKPEDMINAFQHEQAKYSRIAFIGQPGAAGMGLTLTASPMIVYWSNDFNGESRIQSEDRIHRAGMDKNRGATIVDLLHLPTDKKVLDNLKKKRRLQDMSLGELQAILSKAIADSERAL